MYIVFSPHNNYAAALDASKEQKRNYGDDIAYVLRLAQKKVMYSYNIDDLNIDRLREQCTCRQYCPYRVYPG